ncbi:MAG: hypothetical protein UU88_C0006G0028 [Parcubacteria group bacterium GW2011_GWC1_42_11]|uniref:Uncharacterized protein n=1 Tax=Candidatus Nomurabacteria bacterium GW2011_GWC2_42_20 TaxID=1618756 RepID=A0A0G1BLP6_9BACT|nr:MAG: hypothetical protein UU88_C0006G0028 [Parcubacteria group bacterium GW2011_GWC1_42_11]KKS47191.1 MAG: hypothetical protein UV12_C0010G0008 [Candidatus Nomurabacteria bacterium GW2011_GWC2_42_20]KKS59052.1 MAG: hypothetical protein UV24_C0008G0006 [Candidatus Nomurabacteria bacterium GW2011_GWA2_42_41]KKT09267.1 MAG: hypothetical protein UV86_C0010G0008 [Candidatus Nomurabacteria bacterium GW2011_GWB1_43_20]TAN36559.1 MAG: hypothetical protein EPN27_00900 [Patescibacteria group bacterium
MSKPDGKKSKKAKAKTVVPMSRVVRPNKVHGPKPDFTPRPKKTSVEFVSTKAENIWHGYCGLVETAGIIFCVSKQEHSSGHEFRAIRVVSAPVGTELYGLAGSRVYVSVADLHCLNFRSPFKEGTPDYKRQEHIWGFFNQLFTKMCLKGTHAQKVEKEVAT